MPPDKSQHFKKIKLEKKKSKILRKVKRFNVQVIMYMLLCDFAVLYNHHIVTGAIFAYFDLYLVIYVDCRCRLQ
jgi:hypothetical protein